MQIHRTLLLNPPLVWQKNNDKKRLKACIQGNRKSQFQLYEENKVLLYGVCMRYAKNKEEAEDMLQEGFYQILKDLKHFSGKVPLQAWMRKVMVNASLMHIRKYRKLTKVDMDDDTTTFLAGSDDSLWTVDRANAIIHLIRQLPVTQQTVFNMKAIDGYSFVEMADKINMKESTLRSHYLRARKALQTMLKQELY